MTIAPANGWVLGYVAIALIAGVTVLARREPALLRGSSVLLFTVAYVAIAAAALYWTGHPITRLAAAFAGVALALAVALAPWWTVIGAPRASVIGTIEVCFGRVCATYRAAGAGHGFVMDVPGGALHIRLHALPVGNATLISFQASPRHKKGDLLRRLLGKQYSGVLPTIRIRMR